ncbi:hypothetical protein [Pallidibacillus pasinlerensis]|uniref:Flagellin n=1 Tax=Pallidibacillus pasinlerensis TaxID=2703818 RepID=A0ABX0A8B9_9BACI|nr:hypothetical protein [Pallidibacillus pasinlerensis]NCU19067.1 hypothetical protein [Pallidibacillus pasinlerensis]
MGEKSGALTLMITVLVVAVAIILIVQVAMPELATNITDEMNSIVDNVTGSNAGNVNSGK